MCTHSPSLWLDRACALSICVFSSFGEFGEWKSNFSKWRSDHANDMRELERWAVSHSGGDGEPLD